MSERVGLEENNKGLTVSIQTEGEKHVLGVYEGVLLPSPPPHFPVLWDPKSPVCEELTKIWKSKTCILPVQTEGGCSTISSVWAMGLIELVSAALPSSIFFARLLLSALREISLQNYK